MINKIKQNIKASLTWLLLITTGMSILISLVTFSPTDNSAYKFDSALSDYKNFFGYSGSILSDIFLKTLGHCSYIFSFFLILNGARIIAGKNLKWYSWFLLPYLVTLLCFFLSFAQQLTGHFLFDGGFLGKAVHFYFDTYFFNTPYYYYIVSTLLFFTVVSVIFVFNINIKFTNQVLTTIRNTLLLPLKIYSYFSSKRLIKNFNGTMRMKKDNYELKESINKYKTRTRKTNTKYSFPSISLLEEPKVEIGLENDNKRNAEVNKALLSSVLTDFKISGQITDVKQGPIVTLFELTPAPGTLTSSVTSKSEDIARSMSAISTRISTVPGKDALGIEIPNKRRETVFLRELLNSKLYNNNDFKLPLALGKDIFGAPVIVDLSKMPHLLVAGTTGSGKSVGINAMLLSLLYTLTPEECRLILIDPKMLELSVYKEIPHLLTEVVTDPKKAISALKWSVKEMEMRYQMMTHLGVREIDDYNRKVKKILDSGQVIFKETQVGYDSETGKPVMEKKALDLVVYPKIVVVVDELADLMLTSGKEIEGAIQRLSQMARASGIHLIVATQRPSVDVITGTIKSNFPTRISYKVVNKINSRTIIEEQGAEQLLGQGDLLITMLGERLKRVHGPFVKTDEVQAVVEHLKTQGEPEYLQSVTKDDDEAENFNLGLSETGDELYDKAVYIVCREKKASTSFIQRHLQIGYNRAARIIERMESEGVVSPANHVGRREVLVGKDN